MMDELRSEWSAYVRARAERWLYARALVGWEQDRVREDAVEAFAERLGPERLHHVTRLYHLVQPETVAFFKTHLKDIVRSATHVTTPTLDHSRVGARGRID